MKSILDESVFYHSVPVLSIARTMTVDCRICGATILHVELHSELCCHTCVPRRMQVCVPLAAPCNPQLVHSSLAFALQRDEQDLSLNVEDRTASGIARNQVLASTLPIFHQTMHLSGRHGSKSPCHSSARCFENGHSALVPYPEELSNLNRRQTVAGMSGLRGRPWQSGHHLARVCVSFLHSIIFTTYDSAPSRECSKRHLEKMGVTNFGQTICGQHQLWPKP